jgi:pimeloyl-ACP methyl ester carboxylesterase
MPNLSLLKVTIEQVSTSLPVVVLVHGCTQGPSGWDRVHPLLTQAGVRTEVVDMDPRQFDGANGRECASHIAKVSEAHDRVVLVGTSCTGLIIPLVTQFRRIDHFVFVCAGLPAIGRSATEQIFEDGLLHRDWVGYQGQPDSEDAARTFMFNDCDGAILDWSLTTVRLWMPQPAYDDITPLEFWPDIPSTYVLGTKDRIINQEWARSAALDRLGQLPLELETGHCPQNSNPGALAQVLADVTAMTAI